jgi:hypothetical protein
MRKTPLIEKIWITCDWCGKRKYLLPSCARGVQFQSCSVECRSKLTAKFMKEKWKNLTPEERIKWTTKINPENILGQGLIAYHKKLRPARVARVIEVMTAPVPKTYPHERNANKGESGKGNRIEEAMPRGTCTLIAAHHEMMKNDPERLSTEFMQKMCRVNCKCKTPHVSWDEIKAKEAVAFLKQKKPAGFNLEEAEDEIDEMFRRLSK